MPVPDYAEPLIGWRVWRVINGYLQSAVMEDEVWYPFNRMEAYHATYWEDDDGSHDFPSCHCGIYAYQTEAAARAGISRWLPTAVIGTVKLWGTVIVHERGYRAQYAYPNEFVYAKGVFNPDQLARNYGVAYNEDPSWKSVAQYEPSSSNPWGIPSLFGSGGTWMGIPRFGNLFLPNQPWSSLYLLHPDDHKFIVEPPEPKLPEGVKIPDIVRPKQWQRPSGIWAPCYDETPQSPHFLGVDLGDDRGDATSFTVLFSGFLTSPAPPKPKVLISDIGVW